jgi:hypothetical protein
MSTVSTQPEVNSTLALIFQYTVEAYKTFQKLAETLPNPMAATMFKGFASDERDLRDLLEIKYLREGGKMRITLGNDLRFQDIVEGDLSYREMAEMLIVREKTIERKLIEGSQSGSPSHRNLFAYLAATKRAHVVFLERELQLIRTYPDWFRREDAETLIVNGAPE